MKTLSQKAIQNAIKAIHIISIICVVGGFMSMLLSLLTRSRIHFTGGEVYYDKINLALFNIVVLNGFIVIVITAFFYTAFTQWQFRKYPFMLINAAIIFVVFWIGYLRVGFAISGMASISDAGYHIGEMHEQYMKFWDQGIRSLIIILLLLVLMIVTSIAKPFGKKDRKELKHRKGVLVAVAIILVAGVSLFIASEVTLFTTRSLPIADIDVSQVPDGVYEGQNSYGSNTVKVVVTVENHMITSISDPEQSNSVFTKYATGVFRKIIEKQTPNVDAISGATTTSKAYMKAVCDALNIDEKLSSCTSKPQLETPDVNTSSDIYNLYRQAIEEKWDGSKLAENSMSLMLLDCYGTSPFDNIGYTYTDLDGNGKEEFVIALTDAFTDDYYGKLVLDVYSVDDNGEAVHALSSGDRNRYYYAGSNLFANIGSEAASVDVNTTLKLQGGELIDTTTITEPADYQQIKLNLFD